MMLKQNLKVNSNIKLAENIHFMSLSGRCEGISAPGQFINIKLPGQYLRRPISICGYGPDYINIVFKIVGKGTAQLAEVKPGEFLDTLLPLGNGFDVDKSGEKPVLIGGGIGTPPLFALAQALLRKDITPKVIFGFGSVSEVVLVDDFKGLGITPLITTLDGSCGTKGLVTDLMDDLDYDYVYSCGPEPMLRAACEKAPAGQFSFEARMACGFGACMGCTCETLYGYKRICKDGPVLFKEEIKW